MKLSYDSPLLLAYCNTMGHNYINSCFDLRPHLFKPDLFITLDFPYIALFGHQKCNRTNPFKILSIKKHVIM